MEAITFQCKACQHTLRIGADKAGRKARCTKCGAELVIPSATPPPKPPVPAANRDDEEEESGGVYGFKEEAAKPPPVETVKHPSADDEDEDEEDEEDRPPSKPAAAKEDEAAGPKRKITRERKLLEPERWHKVEIGFRIVAVATCIWIGASLLEKVPAVIGFFSFLLGGSAPTYADLAQRYTAGLETPPGSGALSRAEFLLGLVAGGDSRETAVWLVLIAQILIIVRGLLFLTGYGFCLPVPPRYGSRGLVVALLCVGSLNLILGVVFRLLPLTGAIGFGPIFLIAPEIVMNPVNTDRLMPLNIMWSDLPMLEMLLSIVVLSLFYFEPVLFCMFMRAVARAMKNEILDAQARSLMTLGLAQIFAQLTYQMLSITGTSDVLQSVLRVVYLIGAGFLLGQLIWFALVFFRMPAQIEKVLAPEGSSTGRVFQDEEEEQEDEEDEEEDDE